MDALSVFPLEIWEIIISYLDLMNYARLCLSCSSLYVPRNQLINLLRQMGYTSIVLNYLIKYENCSSIELSTQGIRLLRKISLGENYVSAYSAYHKFSKYKYQIFEDTMKSRELPESFNLKILQQEFDHRPEVLVYTKIAIKYNRVETIKRFIDYYKIWIPSILIYCVKNNNLPLFIELVNTYVLCNMVSVIDECFSSRKHEFIKFLEEKYFHKLDNYHISGPSKYYPTDIPNNYIYFY